MAERCSYLHLPAARGHTLHLVAEVVSSMINESGLISDAGAGRWYVLCQHSFKFSPSTDLHSFISWAHSSLGSSRHTNKCSAQSWKICSTSKYFWYFGHNYFCINTDYIRCCWLRTVDHRGCCVVATVNMSITGASCAQLARASHCSSRHNNNYQHHKSEPHREAARSESWILISIIRSH